MGHGRVAGGGGREELVEVGRVVGAHRCFIDGDVAAGVAQEQHHLLDELEHVHGRVDLGAVAAIPHDVDVLDPQAVAVIGQVAVTARHDRHEGVSSRTCG